MKAKFIIVFTAIFVLCTVAGCSAKMIADGGTSVQAESFSENFSESEDTTEMTLSTCESETSEMTTEAPAASTAILSETALKESAAHTAAAMTSATRRGAVITYTPPVTEKPITSAGQTAASATAASVSATAAATSEAATQTQPTTNKGSSGGAVVVTTRVQTTAAKTTAATASGGTVSLCIDCKTAVDYGIRDNAGFAALIPENGILLSADAKLEKGDTVMSLTTRVLKEKGIPLNSQHGYIKGISGLNEKECGGTSGWLYSVNGIFPKNAADTYTLSSGDSVKIVYSVKNGDVTYIS